MQNRDHFIRPIQGNGRDMFGYGRTEIHDDRCPHFGWFAISVCAGLLVWAGMLKWVFL